jgi:hypothetical protein
VVGLASYNASDNTYWIDNIIDWFPTLLNRLCRPDLLLPAATGLEGVWIFPFRTFLASLLACFKPFCSDLRFSCSRLFLMMLSTGGLLFPISIDHLTYQPRREKHTKTRQRSLVEGMHLLFSFEKEN